MNVIYKFCFFHAEAKCEICKNCRMAIKHKNPDGYELAFRITSGFVGAYMTPSLGMDFLSYFFFEDGFVCDNALAATDLVLELVRPSLNRDEALRATELDVCLLLLLATIITSF